MDIAAAGAKGRFETLMAEVACGRSVTITDHGRPVARLVPAECARMVDATGPGFVMPPFDREKARQAAEGLLRRAAACRSAA